MLYNHQGTIAAQIQAGRKIGQPVIFKIFKIFKYQKGEIPVFPGYRERTNFQGKMPDPIGHIRRKPPAVPPPPTLIACTVQEHNLQGPPPTGGTTYTHEDMLAGSEAVSEWWFRGMLLEQI